MKHIATKDERLFVYSMGKRLRVTAICSTNEEANLHMEKHGDETVIAVFGPFVFLANKYDKGEKS